MRTTVALVFVGFLQKKTIEMLYMVSERQEEVSLYRTGRNRCNLAYTQTAGVLVCVGRGDGRLDTYRRFTNKGTKRNETLERIAWNGKGEMPSNRKCVV